MGIDAGEAGALVGMLRAQEARAVGDNPYFEPILQATVDTVIEAIAARLAPDEVLHDAHWSFRSDGFQDATLLVLTNRRVWVVRHEHDEPVTVEPVAFGTPVQLAGKHWPEVKAGVLHIPHAIAGAQVWLAGTTRRASWVPPPGSTPPGWYPDPYRRHQHRWWSGAEWTADIADGGVAGRDRS
jgi:hypothetical protein